MLENKMLVNGVEYQIGRTNMYRIQHDADGTEHKRSDGRASPSEPRERAV